MDINKLMKGRHMKRISLAVLFAMVSFTFVSAASAQTGNPMVGGAAMYKSRDIIDNAVNSADHTTLVAAVKAAGLVETLKGKGPFTVFAPTNEAFDKLPTGTVEMLIKPENKELLTRILTYHVVAGKYDGKKLMSLIKKSKGMATLKSVSGATLSFKKNGMNGITLIDEKGGMANVSIANVFQSNGIIHVIDTVVMPG